MSVQRRRGRPVTLYARKVVTDKRGNETIAVDFETKFETTAAVIPQRSSRAEIPGQQQIDVVRLIVTPDLPNVGLWSQVALDGDMWDVAAPPAYHHGSRRMRHYSIDIRRRPL